ncbi:PAS modulated sigma-54 specific transcriptional regulator, Fis family [Oryzomicrobium terrae]|uniref:PAS modulated sigma-54 specific transcriptional regulator, Fis family n=2 Tax=Oryzomicrobium terrae TaxID=1735038 RepID=A0A5C1E945_9RHOO|nr:PAS modulated sigma-54 specific transcriptional regulator, Fis family [Oryzomicrobium terrae]
MNARLDLPFPPMPLALTAPELVDFQRVRERAMQSLFESLESLCEGTLVVDRDSRIVWINDRYVKRFGFATPEDAIGKRVEEVIPNTLMGEVVRSGKPILLDILEAEPVPFVVTRLPLKDDAGEVIGAVGFALYDKLQPLQPLYGRLSRLQQELAQAQKKLAEERRAKYTFSNFVGISPATMELKRQGRRAARLDTTVLLLGETGTGKELIAHAIHSASDRADKPFVGVNVAAIPDTLLETEFFGAAPGAYTGVDKKGRIGKFELANGGTLFLDEVGDMPLNLQAKLLRALQEQEVEPVGSNRVIKVDARIIAATSVDLAKRVAEGRFRSDLYYRLNVLSVTVPPLRQRLDDLPVLCEHILENIAQRTGLPQRELDASALDLLRRCPWPGNIRELRNALEQATLLSDHLRLSAADFTNLSPATEPAAATASRADDDADAPLTPDDIPAYSEAVADFERRLIRQALAACAGKVPEAAQRLGLGRATLYKKIAALGIATGSTAAKAP